MQSAKSSINNSDNKMTNFADNFWLSSSEFYEKNSHKEHLLNLQNDFGLNVNRLLFSLWYSQTFHELISENFVVKEPQDINRVEKNISDIRSMRTELEAGWKRPIVGHFNMARYHLLESELALEKESQTLLVNFYCKDSIVQNTRLDDTVSDFLNMENIERLCLGKQVVNLIDQELRTRLQNLSLAWIDS